MALQELGRVERTGFRFCPRLRDLPDRKLATIEAATVYKDLAPLIGRRIKADVIREHWGEILRLVASLQAGSVLPSAMLKRLAAFQRQNHEYTTRLVDVTPFDSGTERWFLSYAIRIVKTSLESIAAQPVGVCLS